MNVRQLFGELSRLRRRAYARNKRFRIRPIQERMLHAPMVRTIEHVDEQLVLAEVSLPALYGAFGVLPDFFDDQMINPTKPDTTLRDFLDLFNSRYLESMLDLWDQNHILTQNVLGSASAEGAREAGVLDCLGGRLISGGDDRERAISWHHMPVTRHPANTPAGLMTLVRSFFPELTFEYRGFRPRKRPIPRDQQAQLGNGKRAPGALRLAKNFISGAHINDPGAGFDLLIRDLDLATFQRFLPGEEHPDGENWRALLGQRVEAYTGGRWVCTLTLELRKEEIPAWRLGMKTPQNRRTLGRNQFVKPTRRKNVVIYTGLLTRPAQVSAMGGEQS